MAGDELSFDLRLSGFDKTGRLRVAVWSADQGQDDLVWYDLAVDGDDYHVAVKPSAHGSAGPYYAHLYYWEGTPAFVAGTAFNVSPVSDASSVHADNVDGEAGTAVVVVDGLSCPSGIRQVKIPTWCAANQSDIRWYDASYDADTGSWYCNVSISNHQNHRGAYTSHVYAVNNNGISTCVGSVQFKLVRENEPELTASANDDAGVLTVTLPSELAAGFSNIRAAVWTLENSQDDLTWNTMKKDASGNYVTEVSYDTFNNDGRVAVHVYASDARGVNTFAGDVYINITFKEPEPPAEPAVLTAETDNKEGTFTLTVTNAYAQKGISRLRIAVWSETDGQDDLIWYNATASGDIYVVNGQFASHDYDEGQYYCHAYIADRTGAMIFSCGAEMTFKDESGNVPELVDLGEEGSMETDYRVVIPAKLVPANAVSLETAVWSQKNGQDDLIWYDGTKAGTKWNTDFSIPAHADDPDEGTWYAHTYARTNTGAMVFVKSFTFEIHGIIDGGYSCTTDEDGGIQVTISDIVSPSGTARVRAAIWSTENGQDDIKWLDFSQNDEGIWTLNDNISDHGYYVGEYNVHVYALSGNGIYGFYDGSKVTTAIQPNSWALDGTAETTVRNLWLYNRTASEVHFVVYSLEDGEESAVTYYGTDNGRHFYYTKISMIKHKTPGEYRLLAYADGEQVLDTSFAWTAPAYTEAMQMAESVLNSIGWDLRAAYNWSAAMTYRKAPCYNDEVPEGLVHSEYFAEYGFRNKSGNCYCMASTFLYMARLLGYEGYLIEGYVLSGGTQYKHAWTEIVIDGTTYVFDPNFTNETGRNGYQIMYRQSGTWKYNDYVRVE